MLGDVKDEVMSTMALMLAISVVLMTIVLFLVFPVRRRVMSLMVHTNYALISSLATCGTTEFRCCNKKTASPVKMSTIPMPCWSVIPSSNMK